MPESNDILAMANVGPAVARYLARVGITERSQLTGRDAYALYDELCSKDGRRYDPCLLDTFLSVIDQANGGPAQPWWDYTPDRKRHLASQGCG